MKYLLLASILVIGVVGCQKRDDKGNKVRDGIQIMVMDGCEYVVYAYTDHCAMVHHGNCHNPVHQTK